jgi:hypothetical protein
MSAATPAEIAATAHSFFCAYRALDVRIEDVGPPKVVCLALAVELVLKALLATEGTKYGRIHSLDDLFAALSEVTKQEVLSGVTAPAPEFLRKLAEADTNQAFVRWRYIHELPAAASVSTWTGCLNQLYQSATAILRGRMPESGVGM